MFMGSTVDGKTDNKENKRSCAFKDLSLSFTQTSFGDGVAEIGDGT